MTSQATSSEIFETALGWIAIAATERGIIRTSLPEPTPDNALEAISNLANGTPNTLNHAPNQAINHAKQLLTLYCEGESVNLNNIPIDDTAWTPYTQRARDACCTIPRGEFRTYAWLAATSIRQPQIRSRRRPSDGHQPRPDHHPLPPSNRLQRQTSRLRRNHRPTTKSPTPQKWKAPPTIPSPLMGEG